MSKSILSAAVIAMGAMFCVAGWSAALAEEAVFVCSAPAGHTCQITVRTANGPVSFALPSGERKAVPGITPRADKYCVCDPGPVNETCTAPQLGSWCLGYWADVVPGLNSRNDVKGPTYAGR